MNDHEKFIEFINLLNETSEEKRKWEFIWMPAALILYKYISESFKEFICKKMKNSKLDWSEEQDESEWIKKIKEIPGFFGKLGYFINPSEMFPKNTKNKDLNEIFDKNLKNIEINSLKITSKSPLKNIFNNNFLIDQIHKNQKQLENISNWINDNITTDNYKEICGELFEYLIKEYWYGENNSKSCFTHEDITNLIAKIIDSEKKQITHIYDPACKIGNILTKLSKIKRNFFYFGGEIDEEFNKLCRINLMLHNISYKNFQIKENIFLKQNPSANKKFDIVVSNFLNWNKSWVYLDNKKALKPAEIWELINYYTEILKENGMALILCSKSIIDTRTSNEEYRKNLIDRKYLYSVIELPSKFFNHPSKRNGIMLILKKNKSNSKTFMINLNTDRKLEKMESLWKTPKNSDISKWVTPKSDSNYCIFPSNYFSKKESIKINEEKIKEKLEINIKKFIELNNKKNDNELNLSNLKYSNMTIEEICENGKIFSGNLENRLAIDNKTEYPAITRENIKNLKPSFNKCIKFINEIPAKQKTTSCQYEDILISTKAKNEIGDSTIYLGKENPFIGNGITVLRINEDKKKTQINPKYLIYFLQSKKFQTQIKMSGEQLDKDEIKKIKIPIPSINIQKKIVNYLDKQVDKINNAKSIIKSEKQILNCKIDRIINNYVI